MFDFFSVVDSHVPLIKIVDVGALPVGTAEIYADLAKFGRARIVGFEPLPGQCERLNAMCGPPHLFLPYVVGSGSTRTFCVTNQPDRSSLYEPNTSLLQFFQHSGEETRVVRRQEVQTIPLDDIGEARDCDFLKLDVQGAELDVINGATRLLAEALVVQTEVEFVPLYVNQPLFAEIDQALRKAGYLLHKMGVPHGTCFRPLQTDKTCNLASQMLWADAVYVRGFTKLSRLSAPQLLKLAAILHVVCRSFDMVPVVLRQFDASNGSDFSMRYLRKLTAAPSSSSGLL